MEWNSTVTKDGEASCLLAQTVQHSFESGLGLWVWDHPIFEVVDFDVVDALLIILRLVVFREGP